MLLTVNGNFATEIEDVVLDRILNLYPEEELWTRSIFERAFRTGSIELKDLKKESAKILIPWQIFLLDENNFKDQISHIEEQRKHKISSKLLAKRKGIGSTTSKRIIDRLIRQQEFLTEHTDFPTNDYCSSLVGMTCKKAAEFIVKHLGIDRSAYWEYDREQALDYFIECIEGKNANVCRGVLTNKLLPVHKVVLNNVYKNTSGFVIKDDRIPFIFLPSEINPDEAVCRQLYTLVYLFVIIGLNQYDYFMEKDFRVKSLRQTKTEARLHAITSEILMPQSELKQFQGQEISLSTRNSLCQKLKVTPLALVTTLKIRGVIDDLQYENLKPAEFKSNKVEKPRMRLPRMSTSIRKFCGNHTYKAICSAVKTKSLPNTQLQYLIFGSINKVGFRKFSSEIEK